MKPSKPSNNRRRIPLYCSQPAPKTQDRDSIYYFPPIRDAERKSTSPAPAVAIRSGPQVAQEFSQPLHISSEKDPSAMQRRRQPNTGLGQTNLVNVATGSTTAPVKREEVIPILGYRSRGSMLIANVLDRRVVLDKHNQSQSAETLKTLTMSRAR